MSIFEGACPICGCSGLHACIGSKPVPMTDAERADFERFVKEFVEQCVKEEAE